MRCRALRVGLFALAVFLALPAAALARQASWSVVSSPTLVLPWQQVWPLLIGAVVPLGTYALNHWAPWISQPVKATVMVVGSAAASAVYTAVATNVIGWNAATLQLILTGVLGGLAAHHALWKPSGISTLLGAYADYGLPKRDGKLGPPVPLPTRVAHPAGPLPGPEQASSGPQPGEVRSSAPLGPSAP